MIRCTRLSIFSGGGTSSAPRAANCILLKAAWQRGLDPFCALGFMARGGTGGCASGKRLQFSDRQIEIASNAVRLAAQEFISQGPIVPNRAPASALEPRPDRFAQAT